MDVIKQGSPVLFQYNQTKKWLTTISGDDVLHTHIGIIRHADAIGRRYGSRIITNKEKYVYLLKPTTYDFIMKIQHGTQIVYPKDIGYILARSGLEGGQTVVEIGTGSGALTTALAGVVRPRGRVYTFDVDERFIKIAEKNIRRAGLQKYIIQQKMDIRDSEDTPVRDADLAIIDLGDPWSVIPQVRRMLKGSGSVFAVCPTMNQLERLAGILTQNQFTDIECSERILRTIEAREGKTRHSFQGIGHTAYLCYARKAYFGEDQND
ncbi:MAG: tRNA (adenine-N1)-methyltransferase [Cenarchaeum sp. SB0665_bin_23]|nr:tRNA (adenine-N1)-methyltransferase [Cenarchaeum sp. SB0667_bin_13]MXY37744.1 tRNA (adenine-N1)-methyltransferase [Cenarchaeum sp. SB0664_bin_35]MXY61706.1 tRNA (adenine-N1)-methyltransferase [Cenarchaeum sp. SB0665_bin_23]MXZ93048.1 tRNA (adenine-N1)-methyltransferase [Cenarchaeum sp. SB0666_bin_15]MYB46440.1 tRNA (adenine-N1)-methyltransferase [Cenarchaeum sp. SB0662_bin_33]MYC79143.1 tRNA (adenine-N1)-methyltransferase [Cenarchaeum sp. SB0661_bin_35]MYD58055.1 tRNA (adenine-N1)-methyltr